MRITMSKLETLVSRINTITGSPQYNYSKLESGKYQSNIGNYHIYRCLGVYALERITNKSGGVERILTGSTKGELYNLMQAYILGLIEEF